MEQRITINGKTWIVPSNSIASLIAWLNANAVQANNMRQEIREVINKGEDPRHLITE